MTMTHSRSHRLQRLQALTAISTEGVNALTPSVDQGTVGHTLHQLYKAQQAGYTAVKAVLPALETFLPLLVDRFAQGGRLIYLGAGTSGRLGVLDASEIPPTFGLAPHRVVGLIAGGPPALTSAVEGAEDNGPQGVADLQALPITPMDTVVGLSASGNAPYVVQGLTWAHQQGALTAGLTSNPNAALLNVVAHAFITPTGAEPITGSTRMNAGTAQKLVCNLITTGLLIRLGYTYGNTMVALTPSNHKLEQRAIQMVSALANVSFEQARETLCQTASCPSQWNVRAATLMAYQQISFAQACHQLESTQGRLTPWLDSSAEDFLAPNNPHL
ncbi:MAG: N-acetylmuramic acid 6-phosphate etherase [Vampirovibrionales bacterium]